MKALGPLVATALRELLRESVEAIYPRTCLLCGAAAPDGLACDEHPLPAGPAPPRCGRCAGSLPPALPHGERCAACRRDPPGFGRLVALADYRLQPGVQAWILALKHGGRADLGPALGRVLAGHLLSVSGDGVGRAASVVPVPLHPLRRLERGHDQARLLATGFAEALGLERVDALARRRATPPQGAPGSVSRSANVRSAFRLRARAAGSMAGRAIWLVDDVVTSGSTASECAHVLRRSGCGPIVVACLARAGTRSATGGPFG